MSSFTPLKEFSNISEKFLAPTEPLTSVHQVNQWVSEKTHDRINQILDKLEFDSLMLILNAIYF